MQRKTVTILTKDNEAIPYGSLLSLCREKGWKYNTLSRKKTPFEHEGYVITKEKIR